MTKGTHWGKDLVIQETIRFICGSLTERDYIKKRQIKIPYGRHTYGPQPILLGNMPWVSIKAQGSKIGNFCSIGSDVKFSFLGKHDYSNISTYPFYDFYEKWNYETPLWQKGKPNLSKVEAAPIVIENDVWIANNVTIKEGTRISNGATIAMGSLITKDVPPYALVGGNPARIIKKRFNQEQIDNLLKISWWNWEDKKIKKMLPLLASKDIDEFIRSSIKQL